MYPLQSFCSLVTAYTFLVLEHNFILNYVLFIFHLNAPHCSPDKSRYEEYFCSSITLPSEVVTLSVKPHGKIHYIQELARH